MRGIFNYIHHMILKYDIIHFPILFALGEIPKCLLKCLIMLRSPKINITRNWFLQRRVPSHIMICYVATLGYAVAQLVEALRYKPEGRGFDSRWCHWNFSLT